MRQKQMQKMVKYLLGQLVSINNPNETNRWRTSLGKDEYRNDINLLLVKAIFGALRPWWTKAYSECFDGSDFNVPELNVNSSHPYREFKDNHNQLLSDFTDAVADVLGYYDYEDEES